MDATTENAIRTVARQARTEILNRHAKKSPLCRKIFNRNISRLKTG
jgi:hypothetical protein